MPSASIGIAVDGKIAYTEAFGAARLGTPGGVLTLPARADMAYPIGSVSKQFTATAVLLLQQQGKLSIDDPVAKYFPDLTRANEVRLRDLMTMTSGYEDFAPQDYSIPAWYQPHRPIDTIREWATKPLDFTPGTDHQYSNTNYVLLALILEKITGEPYMQLPSRASCCAPPGSSLRPRPPRLKPSTPTPTATASSRSATSPSRCSRRAKSRSKPKAGTSATASSPCPPPRCSSGTSRSSTSRCSRPRVTRRWKHQRC